MLVHLIFWVLVGARSNVGNTFCILCARFNSHVYLKPTNSPSNKQQHQQQQQQLKKQQQQIQAEHGVRLAFVRLALVKVVRGTEQDARKVVNGGGNCSA